MKNNWRYKKWWVIVSLWLVLASCNSGQQAHEHTYTCPMHPTVISDKPGACPVCGMNLVRTTQAGTEEKVTADILQLAQSPREAVKSSIKTIRGEYKAVRSSVAVQGIVAYDPRNVSTIAARASGRLERVYVKYTFQSVKKNQKVAEIYSPELVTAQREWLYLLKEDKDNEALIRAAHFKLLSLGVSAQQLDAIKNSGQVSNTFTVFSPYDGYVMSAASAPGGSSSVPPAAMNTMNGSSTPIAASPSTLPATDALVKEGDYVTAGETLFTMVNPAALRIELNVPATDVEGLQVKDEVRVRMGTRQQTASVDFIQPFFTTGEAFVKIYLYVQHAQSLRVGQLVEAVIQPSASEGLWVPKEAVVDLGYHSVVFLKERNMFRPRTVVTGNTSAGMIQIVTGITSADELATNAQYLVDSESFIKTSR